MRKQLILSCLAIFLLVSQCPVLLGAETGMGSRMQLSDRFDGWIKAGSPEAMMGSPEENFVSVTFRPALIR
jgi:hypothetical protein